MQTAHHCPTCGRPQPVDFSVFVERERSIIVDGETRRLGFVKWSLLSFLRKHEGQWLSSERIHNAIYGTASDAPEGSSSIRTHMHYLRKKLDGTGYRIASLTGAGSLGYRLERVSP